MTARRQEYQSESIEVTFDPGKCIHSAFCLRGAPDVFDVSRRRWIRPELADADRVAMVVQRCPSGALTYKRLDGGDDERPRSPAAILPAPNGPLHIRGDILLLDNDGQPVEAMTRVTLCRCGQSARKPFCDNSHLRTGFAS